MSTASVQPAPMKADLAATLAHMTIERLREEFATTRRVISAVPEDKAKNSYRPDPKSKTGWELAWHICASDVWFLRGIQESKFDIAAEEKIAKENEPKTVADMVKWYEQETRKGLDRVARLSPEQLAKSVQFFSWTYPNCVYLQFLQHHMIHHRGQLSAYLRAMGSKCPSIYGGSADEPFNG